MSQELGTYDGKKILGTKVKITKAGDGLSTSLATDPLIMHHGDKHFVVLEVEVEKITLEGAGKDIDGLVQVHTLATHAATIIDAKLVSAAIEEQKRRNEEARGIRQLPFDDDASTDEDDE